MSKALTLSEREQYFSFTGHYGDDDTIRKFLAAKQEIFEDNDSYQILINELKAECISMIDKLKTISDKLNDV